LIKPACGDFHVERSAAAGFEQRQVQTRCQHAAESLKSFFGVQLKKLFYKVKWDPYSPMPISCAKIGIQTIYEWTTDWSDYYDDGHEWYGACCWSIYDGSVNRYVVLLVSATD
jgi:hypothetical protein